MIKQEKNEMRQIVSYLFDVLAYDGAEREAYLTRYEKELNKASDAADFFAKILAKDESDLLLRTGAAFFALDKLPHFNDKKSTKNQMSALICLLAERYSQRQNQYEHFDVDDLVELFTANNPHLTAEDVRKAAASSMEKDGELSPATVVCYLIFQTNKFETFKSVLGEQKVDIEEYPFLCLPDRVYPKDADVSVVATEFLRDSVLARAYRDILHHLNTEIKKKQKLN